VTFEGGQGGGRGGVGGRMIIVVSLALTGGQTQATVG